MMRLSKKSAMHYWSKKPDLAGYVKYRFLLTTCRNDGLLYYSAPVDNEKLQIIYTTIDFQKNSFTDTIP